MKLWWASWEWGYDELRMKLWWASCEADEPAVKVMSQLWSW